MINKDVGKSLSHKTGNEILIWIWNNPAVGMSVTNPEQDYSSKTNFQIFRGNQDFFGAKIFQWVNRLWTRLLLVETRSTEQHHNRTQFLSKQKRQNTGYEHDQQSRQHNQQSHQHNQRNLQSEYVKRTYQWTWCQTHHRQTRHQTNIIFLMIVITSNPKSRNTVTIDSRD